jgi:hypothetical protein
MTGGSRSPPSRSKQYSLVTLVLSSTSGPQKDVCRGSRALICKGVGFDLPQVHPVFDQDICQHGLQHRLKFRPGNFLSDALPKADVLGRMLSRSISELERTLGVRLLEHTRHGIELTECGCAILSRSHAAFDELRQGVKDVALRPTSRALSRPLSTGSTSTIRA